MQSQTIHAPATRRRPLSAASWHAHAVCVDADPELFFPEPGVTAQPAIQVCRTCPVQAQCLAWALESGEDFGVWGGASERQRLRLHNLGVAPAEALLALEALPPDEPETDAA